MFDGKAFGEDMTTLVKGYVDRATAPLMQRLAVLEARPSPEKGEKGDAGEPGDVGPGGVGVRDAFLQREGVLVLTLTDGTTRELGTVAGRDGERGEPGEAGPKGDPGEKGEKGDSGVEGRDGAIGEKGLDGRDGSNGADGKDGRDGFTLEDFDVEAGEDGRTVTLKFQQGDVRHAYELVFPVPIDRGVFKADRDEAYQVGDGVTWGGSWWVAQRETKAKPDSPDSGWRLAVKKGRDGKDAK